MEDTATQNQGTKMSVYKNTGEERRQLMSNAGAGCGPITPSTKSCIKWGLYTVRLLRTCVLHSPCSAFQMELIWWIAAAQFNWPFSIFVPFCT